MFPVSMSSSLLTNSLFYLVPSLVIALLIRYFSRFVLAAWFLRLPGTVIHEGLHFCVGFFTFAGPVWISLIPHRIDGQWTLGGVSFVNVRWYNAVWVCIAPLLSLPLCVWLITWRLRTGPSLSVLDPVYWYIAANLLLAAWPSPTDFRVAMRSWPLLLMIGAAVYYRLDQILGIKWVW